MASGRDIKAAFKKASLWHTAVIAGAGDGILILSESIPAKVPSYWRNEEVGLAFVQSYDQGNLEIVGSCEAYLRYLGLDVLLAMSIGTAGPPTQPDPAGNPSVYQNSYQLADNLSGLFGTMVIDKKVSVWEYRSVKVHGFEISGQAGQPVRITFNLMADNLLRAGDEAPANTVATLANVTYPTTALRVMFQQGKFRMNDQAGAALSDANKIYPSAFSLRYRRPMKGDHVADLTRFIQEPTEEGLPEMTLELKYDEYSSDSGLNDITNNLPKKADILFAGAAISGNYNYELKLTFPHLAPVEARASVTGPGKIAQTVRYDCLATTTAPAGMAGVLKPFQINVQNTRSTNPLA